MGSLLSRFAVLAVLVLTTSCATAVDLDSVNGQLKDHDARIGALEKAQAAQKAEAESEVGEKVQGLEDEVEALRKDFADSRWTVGELSEKVESFKAYMDEVEQFMTQFRKKGGEIDKALEDITNRLEADVRGLADKLRKMLEDSTQ
jgi:peptidoglycan hydrolase CwlO-like protein